MSEPAEQDRDKAPAAEPGTAAPAGGAPAGGAPAPSALGYPGYPYGYPPRPTNSLAIASLILGLFSLLSCPPIGIAAIVLGNRARAEIRQRGEDGDALAQTGIIVGWIGVVLTGVIALFFIAFGVIYLGFFATVMTTAPGV